MKFKLIALFFLGCVISNPKCEIEQSKDWQGKCGLLMKTADDKIMKAANTVIFKNKPEGENYANCDGTYYERGRLNERPYFVNDAKQRWVGWNGSSWVITGNQWLNEIVRDQIKGYGGFHSGTGDDLKPNGQWKPYEVFYLQKKDIQKAVYCTDPNKKFCGDGSCSKNNKIHIMADETQDYEYQNIPRGCLDLLNGSRTKISNSESSLKNDGVTAVVFPKYIGEKVYEIPVKLRSRIYSTSIYIRFHNDSNEKLSYYWIDYEGKEKIYSVLQPHSSYQQQTYTTHPWKIYNSTNTISKLIAVYIPPEDLKAGEIVQIFTYNNLDTTIGPKMIVCEKPKPTSQDQVIEKAPGIGGFGGSCTCPNGKVYQVGDNIDHCASLGCIGGISGKCNKAIGKWSNRKVICGQAATEKPPKNDLVKLTHDYRPCAQEGGYCKCKGLVGYGPSKENTFKVIPAKGGIPCNNKVFTDVNYGLKKRCECLSTHPNDQITQDSTTKMIKLGDSYQPCAEEGGKCKCDGFVGYGPTNEGTFKVMKVSGGVSCSNDVFTDVNRGVKKRCKCMASDSDNQVVENSKEVGFYGGSVCTCPNGEVFNVGTDFHTRCRSFEKSCINGVVDPSKCLKKMGPWTRRKVICAQPKIIKEKPVVIIIEAVARADVEDADKAVVEDADNTVVRDADKAVVEDADNAVVEDADKAVVEDADNAVVEDADKAVVEDADNTVVEDADNTVVEDADNTVVEDADNTVVEDADNTVVESDEFIDQLKQEDSLAETTIIKETNEESVRVEFQMTPNKQNLTNKFPIKKFCLYQIDIQKGQELTNSSEPTSEPLCFTLDDKFLKEIEIKKLPKDIASSTKNCFEVQKIPQKDQAMKPIALEIDNGLQKDESFRISKTSICSETERILRNLESQQKDEMYYYVNYHKDASHASIPILKLHMSRADLSEKNLNYSAKMKSPADKYLTIICFGLLGLLVFSLICYLITTRKTSQKISSLDKDEKQIERKDDYSSVLSQNVPTRKSTIDSTGNAAESNE